MIELLMRTGSTDPKVVVRVRTADFGAVEIKWSCGSDDYTLGLTHEEAEFVLFALEAALEDKE